MEQHYYSLTVDPTKLVTIKYLTIDKQSMVIFLTSEVAIATV